MTHSGDAIEFQGRSPAVLLLHGFTGTPWEIRPLTHALQACGYACAAPLLPGHGQTPLALSRMRWRDWSAATDDHVRALLAAHGRVVLVGMSLGALLALDAAARFQDQGVAGVVTLGAALRLAPLTERVLALAQYLGDRLPDLYIPKFRGSDVHDPEARRESRSYSQHPLRAAREFRVGQAAVRRVLPGLRVPLLAVHGLLDRTAPLAASLDLIQRMGSDDVTLVVLPRSGHLVAVDRDRDQVARQVCAFVRRVGGEPDETAARET